MSTDITARIEAAERWREIIALGPVFLAITCFTATLALLAIFARRRGEHRD